MARCDCGPRSAAVVLGAAALASPAVSDAAHPSAAAGASQAAPPSASDTVAAREHFFGAENVGADGRVRPDRVIVSWFSVASLAMAIDGHVVLLDTYIHKGEDRPNYVPTTTDEVAALKPEVIFVGHGHFDHANTGGAAGAPDGRAARRDARALRPGHRSRPPSTPDSPRRSAASRRSRGDRSPARRSASCDRSATGSRSAR